MEIHRRRAVINVLLQFPSPCFLKGEGEGGVIYNLSPTSPPPLETRGRKWHNTLITLLFSLNCLGPGAWAYEIQGRVALEAPYPELKKISVKDKYQQHCSKEQASQSLVLSPEGYVKNAVVSLTGEFKEPFPESGSLPVMDQKNCNFDPHILIVPRERLFRIAISDPLAHDVRAFDGSKMLFHFEMDPSDKPVEKKFDKPSIFLLRCGLHPWMHAFVVSAEHPYYAISNDRGEFHLANVPPGRYNLRIWHETLGEAQIPVEVEKDLRGFSYTFPNAGQKIS